MSNRNVKKSLAGLILGGVAFVPWCMKAARCRSNLPTVLFSLLLTATVSVSQEPRAGDGREQFTPSVTASTAEGRVRFAAPNEVVRLELEVLSEGGQTLFEAVTKGSVLDWTLQDAQGERLPAGSYLCVLTVKSPTGRITQRLAAVEVTAEGRAEVRPVEAGQMSTAQAEAVGPVASDAALAVLKADGAGEATVLAHDGTEGQLTRTRGALSFRVGDFFAGTDREQMRITEDGKVGVGTTKPEATLDVAGEVRASDGFRFADGSRLFVDEKGALTRTSAEGERLPGLGAAVAAATAGRLAKFADAAGTLADSSVFESGGFVGIGTTAPEGTFHIQSPDTTVFKVVSTGAPNAGRAVFQMYRGASAQTANGWDFGYNTDLATEGFIIRELTNGGSQPRVSIQKGTGNFGIGTTSPDTKLDIHGSVSSDNGVALKLYNSNASNFNRWFLGTGGAVVAADAFSIGDTSNYKMTIRSSGNVGIGTTTPQSKLEVHGDIRLGSSGQYRATSGEENLRIVRGVVDGLFSDPPVINAGRGFSVSKLSGGDYEITLETCFATIPAVVATSVQANPARTVTVQNVSGCKFQLHIEDDLNRVFHFIAIGPR